MKEANNMANQIGVEALKQVESLKESLISDEKDKNLPPDVKFGQVTCAREWLIYFPQTHSARKVSTFYPTFANR